MRKQALNRQEAETLVTAARLVRRDRAVLDDIPRFYGGILGWDIDSNKKRVWLDVSEGSNSLKSIQFFRNETGKRGKFWASPRGTGKSVIASSEAVRFVLLDRDINIVYIAQNVEKGRERSVWIRDKLKSLESRYGEFETSDWSTDGWTVKRPSGPGLNKTLRVLSPESPNTGGHWDIAILDDVVCDENNSSVIRRRKVCSFFDGFCAQMLGGSRIWVIGTLYPHYNLYRDILERHKNLFDIQIVGARTENGEPTYPWLTDEHLADMKQLLRTEARYKAQFENRLIGGDDVLFIPEEVQMGTSPGNMWTYLLVDLGASEKEMRHTSKTAMLLVGRTHDDNIWLLDGYVGKGNIEVSGRQFAALLGRAKTRNQMPLYYIIETHGLSVTGWWVLERHAKDAGFNIGHMMVTRSNDKPSRIQPLYPHIHAGKVWVDSRSFPPLLFRKDAMGRAHGVLAESMDKFNPLDNDESFDDLDALADAVTVDKGGAYICPCPPAPRGFEKPLTDYDKAVRAVQERTHKEGVVFLR